MNREAGAGSVLVVGVVGALLVLAGGLGTLGQAAVARHRAEAAADLAALAAADAALGRAPGDPCARATRTAAAGGASVVGCVTAPDSSVTVEVQVRPGGAAGLLGVASAVARAGPAAEVRSRGAG